MLVMTLLGLSSAVGQMEDRGQGLGQGAAISRGLGALGHGDGIKVEEHRQNVNEPTYK